MSAGPAARIIGDYRDRPAAPARRRRGPARARASIELHKAIWASLRDGGAEGLRAGRGGVSDEPRQARSSLQVLVGGRPSVWLLRRAGTSDRCHPVLDDRPKQRSQFFFSTPRRRAARGIVRAEFATLRRRSGSISAITLIETRARLRRSARSAASCSASGSRAARCWPPCSIPTSRPRTRCRAWCWRRSSRCGSGSASGRRWRSASRWCSSSSSSTSTRA